MTAGNEGNLLAWWPGAVFYQVYPPSFADGSGDLAGLTDRLDSYGNEFPFCSAFSRAITTRQGNLCFHEPGAVEFADGPAV